MHRAVLACLLLVSLSFCSLGLIAQDGLKPAPPPARVDPPSPTATAEELETRGDELRQLKAYVDAVDYYRAALNKQKSAAAFNKLGIAELQLNRLKDAQKDFSRSIKADKQYAEPRNNLGVIYYKRGKYGRAIKEYTKAIALNPNAASFHSNLGSAYFAQKKFELAAAEYGRAIQIDPDIFDRMSGAGVSAHLQSPADKAYFSYVLARMYAQMGDFDRSLQALRRAMEDGYDVKGKVYEDEKFAKLREDPRFSALMSNKPVAVSQ